MKWHTQASVPGIVASFLAIILSAFGGVFASDAPDDGLPLWELGIGAAAFHQPNYPGSDVRTTTGLPFSYIIYRGDWFLIDHLGEVRGLHGPGSSHRLLHVHRQQQANPDLLPQTGQDLSAQLLRNKYP